jgi:hypothetical protein
MKYNEHPDLKEFVDKINEYANDCMRSDGMIESHTLPACINISCKNVNGYWEDYEIVEINQEYLGGCGCPSGIEIVIKKA